MTICIRPNKIHLGRNGRDGIAGMVGLPGDPGAPGERGVCASYCSSDGGVFYIDQKHPIFEDPQN